MTEFPLEVTSETNMARQRRVSWSMASAMLEDAS